MIVASILSALGFFLTAGVTQTKGLRLGGAILVPTLVVYALKDFVTLPVFVVSTVIAYLLLWQAKERTLVYGRDEFLVALAGGSLVPVGVYLIVSTLRPSLLGLNPLVFVGSILPGLAAYNIAQTKPEYRRQDLVYLSVLVVSLVGLGAILVNPWTARWIGGATPLLLFAETSDIAVYTGSVVVGDLPPDIALRTDTLVFFIVGTAAAEVVRRIFGIRIGIISMTLLALFALVSGWLLVLFVLTAAVSLVGIWITHHRTLLYGRVLISIGCGIGTLAGLAFATQLPVVRGLSALFVGVLAGVDAYAVHTAPPRERRQQAFLFVAAFLGMLLLLRAFIDPFPLGVLQEYTGIHVAIGLVITLACLAVAYVQRIPSPSDEDVLSASVLSGGDG